MGVETALLFCAIRLTETLGTLSFSRGTRAGYPDMKWRCVCGLKDTR